jgi:hypothetical protein
MDLSTIVSAVEPGRRSYDNVTRDVRFRTSRLFGCVIT